MTCDSCSKACTQATRGPAASTAGAYWCDDCARAAGVRIPAVALSDALEIARRAKVEADAADKAARRAARAERARALLAEIRRRREAKLAKPAVEPEIVEPEPEAIRADMSLAPEPARFALVPERPTRPGPASVRATPTFKPCAHSDHANCAGAYFDDAGAPVNCPCACHRQGAMFAAAKPQRSLF